MKDYYIEQPGILIDNFIISSWHKTGTVLIKMIFKEYNRIKPIEYSRNKYNFKYYNYQLTKEAFFNYVFFELERKKVIVFIRNPYEHIVSSVRYHTTIGRNGVIGTRGKGSPTINKYNQAVCDLDNIDDQLLFEMNNRCKGIIYAMYNLVYSIKNYVVHNKNNPTSNILDSFLIIKLEEFWTDESRSLASKKICDHIPELDYDIFHKVVLTHTKFKYNKTTNVFNYTYKDIFKEQHYIEFDKIFPSDIMHVLEYNK
jgi:hypothetical protein